MKATTRRAIADWLDGLAEQYTVIAPNLVGDELLYGPVLSSDEIVFDFQRTALSPKTFFLPDTQIILEIHRRNREVALTEPSLERAQVIFGLRPCDARGLCSLDALLLGRAPADAYYSERREKTTLIGLACSQLWDDCFCTSLGSAPEDASAVDLMIYQMEREYLIEALTDKGKKLLEGLAVEDTAHAGPMSDSSGSQVPVLPPEAWDGIFDHPYWQRMADRCLSCHACTYACPTCRCFDVRDVTLASGPGYAHNQRLRAWDSCMAAAYRRIAGGHNPRPTTSQRLRNRFYCKFCYSSHSFGSVACVGCGRCIAICPVGIDIREMLADVANLAQVQV
jgi:ferredoxin